MHRKTRIFKKHMQNQGTNAKKTKFSPGLIFEPSSLLKAIEAGDHGTIRKILDHLNNHPEVKNQFVIELNDKKQNALILAASKGYEELVDLLLNLNFDIEHKDSFGCTVTDYLVRISELDQLVDTLDTQQNLSQEDSQTLLADVDLLQMRFDKCKIGESITYSEKNINQEGRIPKFKQEELRPYRSYAKEREIQLLRHVATQLYFGFSDYLDLNQKKTSKLTEIQIMHHEYLDEKNEVKDNLFIAVNDYATAEKLVQYIKDTQNLQKILQREYQPNNLEGVIRSRRYASKLQQRVYNDKPINYADDQDQLHTQRIINILKNGKISALHPSYHANEISGSTPDLINFTLDKDNQSIYILVPQGCSFKSRHAEEFLSDIADVLKQSKKQTYSAIAGKKRPCFTCSGRMRKSSINNVNRYPGRFWNEAFNNQSHTVASATMKLLLTEPSHVSISEDKDGKTKPTKLRDYTSGSDSEAETSPKLRKNLK